MENSKYQYEPIEKFNISIERQEELISKIQKKIGIKDSIALFKITSLVENEQECAFLFDWLNKENITIRGFNSTLEKELENYERILRVGESGDITKGYKTPLMPTEERIKLFEILSTLPKDSDEYGEMVKKIAEGSLRLVDWVLWKMPVIRNMKSSSFDEDDKRQWGAIALTNAVEHFDISLGYQFSTYAVACIMHNLTREWERINEIPANMHTKIRAIEDIRKSFIEEIGREPSKEELSEILGMSETMLETINSAKSRLNIEFYSEKNDNDEMIDGTDATEVTKVDELSFLEGDYFEEEKVNNQLPYSEEKEEDIEKVDEWSAREIIEAQLRTLTPREEHVIKLRFGLYDGRPRTLEEVGQEYNITRERIRQIEAKALRKLRHPSRARHLRSFLDR